MADVSVRAARPGDAATIARIQRDTLALAYERIVPPETFAALADPQTRAGIEQMIAATIAAGRGRVFVALEGDTVVGIAAAGPALGAPADDSSPATEDHLEPGDEDGEHTGFLEQILVEPRWGRRGHGSRLLAAVADYFETSGFVRAITWVPQRNEATVNLLTSAGWAADGYTRGLDAAGVTMTEIRLHTSLSS